MLFPRFFVALWLVVASCAGANEPKPLEIATVLQPGGFLHAALSPDGRHVAAVGHDGLGYRVLLIKTEDRSHRIIAGSKSKQEGFYIYRQLPRRVLWVSNELLAIDYTHGAEVIRLNGDFVREIGTGLIGKAKPADPDDLRLIAFDDDERTEVSLIDLNRKPRQRMRWPMRGTAEHFAFDSDGRLRVVTLRNSAFWRDSTSFAHWFLTDAGDWIELERFGVDAETWTPLAAERRAPGEPTQLVVRSRHDRDTYAIYRYDPLTRAFGELLAVDPHDDINSFDDLQGSRYRSVVTGGMKPRRHWLDPRWKALQAEVDAALPGRINSLQGEPDGMVLIFSYGDRDPGRWHLLDTRSWEMRHLLSWDEAVDKVALRPSEVIRYASSDGLTIPAYLTRPAGDGPKPLVVLVHGGPFARDYWGYQADVQLMATRGYLVLQPQFRGSTGFGKAFERAGIGQWGRGMQDDLTAGVRHLVQLGLADPQRVCIVGASYGGYAALWGLLSTPELYRCGVSVSGVSDIAHMLSDSSDSNDSKVGREFLRLRIGDLERDRDRLDAVSPVRHADRLRAPLLLIHGTEDRRVPISHPKLMMKALDRAGKRYEWLPLEGADHGLSRTMDRAAYFKALLEFLDRQLMPAPAGKP